MRLDVLSNKIREDVTQGTANVSNDAIKSYYDKNAQQFSQQPVPFRAGRLAEEVLQAWHRSRLPARLEAHADRVDPLVCRQRQRIAALVPFRFHRCFLLADVSPLPLARLVVRTVNGAAAETYAGSAWQIEGWTVGVFRWLEFVRSLNASAETDPPLPWPDGLTGGRMENVGQQRYAAREALARLHPLSETLQVLSRPGAQDGVARLAAPEHEQIAENLGWRRDLSDFLGWLYTAEAMAAGGEGVAP